MKATVVPPSSENPTEKFENKNQDRHMRDWFNSVCVNANLPKYMQPGLEVTYVKD